MIHVAKNPAASNHRTVLRFAIMINLVHLVIMFFQAMMSTVIWSETLQFPSGSFLSALADETAIMPLTSVSVTAFGNPRDLAQNLHGAGAWIVLPADLTSCPTCSESAIQ